MSDVKTYGGDTLAEVAARCGDAAEVARDLIAAQARIAGLEELQRETVAQGRDEILGLRAKLAAAESTIAMVRELLEGARTGEVRWAFQRLRKELEAVLPPPAMGGQRAAVGDGIADDTEAIQRGARLRSADPAAPLAIADLPDWWDARRVRLGKPDRSTCAAELRAALAHEINGPGHVVVGDPIADAVAAIERAGGAVVSSRALANGATEIVYQLGKPPAA